MLIAGVLSGALNVSLPRLGYYLGRKEHDSYEYLIRQWFPYSSS